MYGPCPYHTAHIEKVLDESNHKPMDTYTNRKRKLSAKLTAKLNLSSKTINSASTNQAHLFYAIDQSVRSKLARDSAIVATSFEYLENFGGLQPHTVLKLYAIILPRSKIQVGHDQSYAKIFCCIYSTNFLT